MVVADGSSEKSCWWLCPTKTEEEAPNRPFEGKGGGDSAVVVEAAM